MTPIEMIAAGVLLMLLVPITLTDIRERRIPNSLNAGLAVAGLIFQAIVAPSWSAMLPVVLAPLAVILTFVGLIALMKLLRRSGTLGLGDVKFLAATSIWVGFVGSTLVFVVASLLALIFTIARAPWRKVNLRAAIPFGPFLAASLALVFAISATMAYPVPPHASEAVESQG